ncbi:MAG TPA: GAF domain-containing protein, partial [Methylotenera sp.]|nr:GAF domain-containing protein [Methylotenera sp.]
MSSTSSGSTTNILQARNEFLANGHVREGAITEAIERSWRRCLASGIDTQSPSNIEVVTAQELTRKREQNHQLLALARPEMETLSEQIAHTRNVVILTDHEGLILHSMGSQHLFGEEQRLALSAGTSWNESQRGTNAIGTAIFEQSALTVQGAEHFMTYHHSLNCSAVPIFGAENQLIATLDVSNDYNVSQQHTLALVKMSAQMIENRLFLASHQSDVVLHFHARPEFIGTLWEGVAMFTDHGELVATNRSGQFQLGLNTQHPHLNTAHNKPPLNFNQLFDMSIENLLRQIDGTEKLVMPLRMNNGARIYVQVELLHKKPPLSKPAVIIKRTSA